MDVRHTLTTKHLLPLLDFRGNERCGFLVERDGVIVDVWPTPSLVPAPDSYAIGRNAWIAAWRRARADGLRIAGSIHSHPNGPEGPSERDLDLARRLPRREVRAVWHPRTGRLTIYGRGGILSEEILPRPRWLRHLAPLFWD